MRVPISTYRLQVNDDFTLHDARAIVPYLARLGVSDLYLSPVFEAQPGSGHGYDVTDPTRVRASVGGEDALRALSDDAHQHGMGIVMDIVPNHMAASVNNPWWRDVLQRGRQSQYAGFFDIDWGTPEETRRLRLPILGGELRELVAAGELSIDPAAGEAVYYDTRLPLAPGSLQADADLLEGAGKAEATLRILERQHYELAYWRTAAEDMNYRRFFDITDLAGVRVEDENVFNATHALIRTLAADGTITGLRIDHIDGLRDPKGYLDQLRASVRGPGGEPIYTIVEKILERDERLPSDWACEGTTGYEFLNLATGLLLDADGYSGLEQFYQRLTGDTKAFGELVREKKLLVLGRLFGSELRSLGRSLARLTRLEEEAARSILAEVTASMGVYRTYIRSRSVDDEDRRRLEEALADAGARNPELDFEPFRRIVLMEAAHVDEDTLDWIMRWQQFTGPVMAKGFEDTALYCHNVLLAANEVGSDPVRPAIAGDHLHELLEERRTRSPRSLNATATHDTKRGEDTRARIAVLSEVSDEWRRKLRSWVRDGEAWKAEIADDEDSVVPDADVDSLLYQTLVGAWPLEDVSPGFTDRIKAYMTKAVREAKEQTSWRRPDEDFEEALDRFIDLLMSEFGREGLTEEVGRFAMKVAPHGAINSLAQLLLKITAPGIPDIYQGTELWSFTLVDPDNRQPVDYEERRRRLEELQELVERPDARRAAELLESWRTGSIKLLVTALSLHCRSRHPDVFGRGSCVPLPADGSRREHVFAYARQLDGEACVILLPRRTTALGADIPVIPPDAWGDTSVALPGALRGAWRNALTGERVEAGERLVLGDVLRTLPLALLERD